LTPEARLNINVLKGIVRRAKKTQLLYMTAVIVLTLFTEIVAVYSENQTKPENTLCAQNAALLTVS
jgi:hypothetical protein